MADKKLATEEPEELVFVKDAIPGVKDVRVTKNGFDVIIKGRKEITVPEGFFGDIKPGDKLYFTVPKPDPFDVAVRHSVAAFDEKRKKDSEQNIVHLLAASAQDLARQYGEEELRLWIWAEPFVETFEKDEAPDGNPPMYIWTAKRRELKILPVPVESYAEALVRFLRIRFEERGWQVMRVTNETGPYVGCFMIKKERVVRKRK